VDSGVKWVVVAAGLVAGANDLELRAILATVEQTQLLKLLSN
jgi:hypothetical protein